jgi:RHS repeat-associated protein
VQGPNGTLKGLMVFGTSGLDVALPVLPDTGTYTIVIDPQGNTGSATLTLSEDVVGTVVAGGSSTTVTTTRAGQNARISFTGTAGEHLGFALTADTIGTSGCCSASVSLVKATTGEPLVQLLSAVGRDGAQENLRPLPDDGTYWIIVDPGTLNTGDTGSVTVTLSDDIPTTVAVGGATSTTTISRVGQNARFTFTGTAGEHLGIALSGVTIGTSGCCSSMVSVLKADDSTLQNAESFGTDGGQVNVKTLPVSGTYTIFIDPGVLHATDTGSVTVTLTDDATSGIVVGGASATENVSRIGQNGRFTFSGMAGEPLQVTVTGDTINPGWLSVTVVAPDDSTVGGLPGIIFQPGGTMAATLGTLTGTYTVFVDPQSLATGSVTVSIARAAPFQPLSQTYGTCGGIGVNALADSECLADPVNSLTGAFTVTATDLTLAAPGVAFAFTRNYTSADATVGAFGRGWTDNYAASMTIQTNGDAILHGDEGQQVFFGKQSDGTFVGAGGSLSVLTAVTGGYKLVTHSQITYQFNSAGLLQSELDRNGQGLTFGYDVSGRLSTITDAVGHVASLGYDASNLVSSVATPDGRTVSYGYTSGLLTSVTLPDPDGVGPLAAPVWAYTYDAGGRLWKEIDPNLHTQATNVYDPTTGRVTQQTDANNKTTTFAWDAATQTATITDPDNHVWKDVYQNNVLIKRIDPAGEITQFGHDLGLDTTGVTSPNGTDTTSMSYVNGNLMTATAPTSLGGVQQTFTYDSQNNVKTITDTRSKLTEYGYDTAGNSNSITVDGQAVFGATYNTQGQMLTSTDGNGKQTGYTYDASSNVASVTGPDPDGAGPLAASKTTYTYDSMGNVLSKVDPLGNCSGCTPAGYTTTHTYDANGNLLTETDPLAHTTTYTYDAAGDQSSVKDANDHLTTYSYDNANHLLQTTGADPDGAGPLEAPITKYSYDDAGNRQTMIGPRGNCSGCNPATYTSSYTYDQNNRLASITTPKGEKTTYTYDVNGNLASTVDPRGNVQGANPDDYKTTYTYDAAGRLLTTTDPLAHVSTNHYDAVGNLDWTKDANLHQTSFTYDAAGRILTVTAPDNGLTTYTYEGNGKIKTRKDDNNHLTTYNYDDAGRLIQTIGPDPDGIGPLTVPLTTRSYDVNSNLTSTTDPNGNATQTAGDGTTSYAYDHANRLTGISYSDSTPQLSYGYDNVGNRTSMSDGSGSVSYGYDNLNRLTSSTRGANTFAYAYDPANDIISRTYPGSIETSYAYDEENRLSTATRGGATTSYSYDPASHISQAALPATNGYIETRTYDRAGRLTEIKNAKGASTLSDYVSTLDAVGNPTQIVQTGALSATQTYSYDAADRLLSVCFQTGSCPGGSDPFIRWSYDKVGNRLTEARGTSLATSGYNAVDELTQTSTQNLGPSLYASQTQTDGAQPYWRLGEASGTTFASAVGTFNGTWSGSPTLGSPGALTGDTNTAVTLTTNTQFGTVPNASQLSKTNNFSLELWLKRTKNATLQAVAGKPLTTTTKSENYAVWIDTSNHARFEVGAGTKSATVTCTAHPLDTNWHQLVGTFASGTVKIYYDGTLCNTATANFSSAGTNTSAFNVGLSGTSDYNGGLDEIAPYGTALTAAQISDHYSKGTNAPSILSYGYDNNGNQTSAGQTTLSYDLANRLKTYTSGTTTTTYSYDGDNNRLQASTGALASQKTNYLWDTNQAISQLALESDGNNAALRRYNYGARRISMTSGGNNYYYHYDPLGSVTNLTNATGSTQWTDSYEPYGALHSEAQNDPNAPYNPMKFVGELQDATGAYYLRARQYDPSSARFLQLDPAAAPAGSALSSYAYASDQPTVMIDPTGQTFEPSDAGLAVAAEVTSGFEGGSPRTLYSANSETTLFGYDLAASLEARNQRIATAYNYFVNKGLKNFHSAGLVGNFLEESNLDPRSNQNGGGPGRGIAQWSVDGRWKSLLAFARKQKVSPLTLPLQLHFVWHELTGSFSYALRDLRRTRNVVDATKVVEKEYEFPSIPHESVRIYWAKYVLKHYG